MKKYVLNNSYFKHRKDNDPDRIIEIVSFFKEKGELPFRYNGDNWVYDATVERQKRTGVINSQYLTPDKTASRLAELAMMYQYANNTVLDACCGTGQITAQLLKNGFVVEGFDFDHEMVEICQMMYPEGKFSQTDFNEQADQTEYGLIVSNPPYEIKALQNFLGWLYENLSNTGKAILLLPVGFINKKRPKALAEMLAKFRCIHQEKMIENFEQTNFSAEIVILELCKYKDEQIIESTISVPAIENNITQETNERTEITNSELQKEVSEIPEVKENKILAELLEPSDQIRQINLTYISLNPFNPRKYHTDEDLGELAESIKVHGVIQPITVRVNGNGYEIVCGERRYRSSLIAGLETIPAIIKNYTDDEAMEITIIENLQRKDISPVEEAISFGKLIEIRNYTMDDLTKQFGKSDKYIRSRLQLRNLIDEAAALLVNNEITIGIALELSKYNHDVQKNVFEEHFDEESYSCWKSLKINDFAKRIESNYTTDLEKYSFDKTECASCPFNSATYNLFADGKCGKCQNSECLMSRQKEFMLSSALELVNKDSKLDICVSPYAETGTVAENLKEMGYEVTSGVYPKSLPKTPILPEKEQFDTDKEYEEAMIEYESDLTCYNEEVEEIERKVKEGTAIKMIDVSKNVPTLCYRDVSNDDKNDRKEANPIAKLKVQDKRNKEISIEKTVDDVKKFINSKTIQDAEFTDFEGDLLYFVMLEYLGYSHRKLFGNKNSCMDDKERADLMSKLTDQQKNLVRRDFIVHHLVNTFADCKQSELLMRFSQLHFPEETSEIQKKYDTVYQKRHERINERIKEYEKIAKQLAQTSDSQQQGQALEHAPINSNEDKAGNNPVTDLLIEENKDQVVATPDQTLPDSENFGLDCDDVEKYEGTIETLEVDMFAEVA